MLIPWLIPQPTWTAPCVCWAHWTVRSSGISPRRPIDIIATTIITWTIDPSRTRCDLNSFLQCKERKHLPTKMTSRSRKRVYQWHSFQRSYERWLTIVSTSKPRSTTFLRQFPNAISKRICILKTAISASRKRDWNAEGGWIYRPTKSIRTAHLRWHLIEEMVMQTTADRKCKVNAKENLRGCDLRE